MVAFLRSFFFWSCLQLVIGQVRILFIGDSLDRYLVQDWCSHNNGTIFMENSMSTPSTSTQSTTVHEIFKVFGRRRRSWEVRLCDSKRNDVVLTAVANKFGVKPSPPWHSPIATMSGMEHELNVTSFDVDSLFRFAILPALRPLEIISGGPPHGVFVTSAYWDLSHPDPDQLRLLNSSFWLDAWSKNASELMKTVANLSESACWKAWHLPPPFYTVSHHWNTEYALGLLRRMNAAAEKIADTYGFRLVDFSEVIKSFNAQQSRLGGGGRISLRRQNDPLHPSPQALKVVGDYIVQQVIKACSISRKRNK
jgi:hypothetical protein